jgi:hypothetical protein
MLNRRLLLTSAALSPAILGLSNTRANAPSDTRPPSALTKAELLEVFMRMAGSLDDRLVIWWFEGVRYGVADATTVPLFGMKVGMFHRFFRQPDNTFALAMFELTYYTDLASGNLLHEFKNPYTGETNTVRHVRLGPSIRYQSAAGQQVPPDPAIVEYSSQLGPALIRGDHLWIPTDVTAKIQLPSPKAPRIHINHFTTISGKLSETSNQAILSAPATINFQNILRWEPWMKMGDHPGAMMSRAAGLKLEAIEDLPQDYLNIAHAQNAKLISDPIATLDKKVAQIKAELPSATNN